MVLTIFTYCPPSGNYNLHNLPVEHQDTGWINDENPLERAAANQRSRDFQTPIDEVDAAARILDPIFTGVALPSDQTPEFGRFLKDYHITEW